MVSRTANRQTSGTELNGTRDRYRMDDTYKHMSYVLLMTLTSLAINCMLLLCLIGFLVSL